jgi:hypothetical protein
MFAFVPSYPGPGGWPAMKASVGHEWMVSQLRRHSKTSVSVELYQVSIRFGRYDGHTAQEADAINVLSGELILIVNNRSEVIVKRI